MGRFVSATGQFLLATYGQFSCPPTGSFSCPLTPTNATNFVFIESDGVIVIFGAGQQAR